MCEERNDLEAALSLMVHDLDPSSLTGPEAKLLVGFFSRLERLAVAGKALCALRVCETGASNKKATATPVNGLPPRAASPWEALCPC